MKPRITDLTVKGFRSLKSFSAEGLGRVNLITGRNNTGKSSVLEALRILTSGGSPSVISSILRYREEDLEDVDETSAMQVSDALSQVASLFSGFPQFGENPDPIEFEAEGGLGKLELAMRVGWLTRASRPDRSRRLVEREAHLPLSDIEDEGLPALVIESLQEKHTVPLHYLSRRSYTGRLHRPDFGEKQRIPSIFVSPYGGERTANLGTLWDNIALSDGEEDVVEALRIIDPEISAVSMVGGETPRQFRTAIVRSANFSRPVPLRSFGDGLNRLFGIVLSLVNAKGGLLLIDEFENGMHHTVQLDAWRTIFRLAGTLGAQVFATSHSWDAVESFQQAAAEIPEEGVLIRLSRKGEDVIPTLFRENELAIATRDRIEVR